MSRVAYVNGRYVPHRMAAIHIEDRGFQFADGVYEVCEIWRGALVDERRHLDRLERSLSELRLALPMSRAALNAVLREVVRRNGVVEGLAYLQVTRGVARRDHAFPAIPVRPSVVATARAVDRMALETNADRGIAIVTLPDERWARVDIKTVQLVPNVLAKQAAREAGAREAWFVDASGFVTEGASTNAWIVTKDGTLVTRPAEFGILRGVTRAVVMDLAAHRRMKVEERPFTVAEAKSAPEAFATGASTLVMPVVRIDGEPVGDGRPGPVATRLRAAFHDVAEIGRLILSSF